MDVDLALTAFRDDRRRQAAHRELKALVDLAHEHAVGGKHLRARFVQAGWIAAGGDADDPRIVRAAAAFEWLQASALVHDDLIDDSDTRRGRATIHRTHGPHHAVLVGDLLLAWADQALHESAPEASDWHLSDALRYWDVCKNEVIMGQYLDVTADSRDDLGIDDALTVVTLKSAKYTIERPLHVGAALAGGSAELLGHLSAYALPLGQAFQLRDDVLGVFGDPAVTGKPAGDDLREGKRTVLVARAAERVGVDRVIALLGHDAGVSELTTLLETSGARGAVEADIARLEGEAHAALSPLEEPGRSVLAALATAATRRNH